MLCAPLLMLGEALLWSQRYAALHIPWPDLWQQANHLLSSHQEQLCSELLSSCLQTDFALHPHCHELETEGFWRASEERNTWIHPAVMTQTPILRIACTPWSLFLRCGFRKETSLRVSEWVSGGLTPCRQLRPSSRREHVRTSNYSTFKLSNIQTISSNYQTKTC